MPTDTIIIPPTADEATLVSKIYTEDQGPRKGIYLTFANAQRLLNFHIPGKQLKELSYFKRGYNNRVYLARCTDATEYVIRLGGRFWDHKKITNEAMALEMARSALDDIAQVPAFIGTSIQESKIHLDESSRIIPHDYIIMDRLPGVPLDSVWEDLSQDEKKKVVDQVSEIFSRLRSINLKAIGNFVEAPSGEATVGPLMESGGGPFSSWGEFVAGNIKQETTYMLQSKDRFIETLPYLPRIEALVEKVKTGELEKRFGEKGTLLKRAKVDNPISFLHGDFEARNMLVIGTKITGLHDFEFAGGFPSEQEWCAGFEWLFARSEDPYDEGEQNKLQQMTSDQKELLEYFLRILKERYGILQYGKDNQEYKVVLYHLQANIAPWWLRDLPRDSWTEKQIKSMKTAADSLDKALSFLGC
ncbi:kinase-like domain-containing protein [Gamsiella multidivaricata]|uniref:kinase-like domain-containing protein n=1 Tax=Gamsiella multidivaricata TaxID=101098 RepID=UPI00221F2B48|nr:kinase-like domain-containing protein [Gamsiella multidivaricata]KAG0364492.1 hypothetical protein BGZ54_007445 [Gamsiella multidivaricata]KAI7832385.1 kinase-like domain-containing protein [Gamsiella multidivaricata]